MKGVCMLTSFLLAALFIQTGESQSKDKNIFCYYSSSANARPSVGKFWPEHVDPFLCTHLIFAFVDITKDGRDLTANNWNDLGADGLYARTMKLKEKNPKLKILLAVGGWRIGSKPFIPIMESEDNMKTWVKNVVIYLRKYGFDGLDMDWEFPAWRGSKAEDKFGFTRLMKYLFDAFAAEAKSSGKEKMILTLATASSTFYIEKAYEATEIHKYIDYMLLMTYNYHGSGWEKTTGHHSPLLPHRSDPEGEQRQLYQQWSITYWLNLGVPKSKLIVGLPTYGLGYKLTDEKNHGIRASAEGGNTKGKYTGESGILSLYEICEKIQHDGWDVEWIYDQRVPYAHGNGEWVGFESPDSIALKAKNILKRDLAGAFVWSVEMDDFTGHCGGSKFPLLRTIHNVLLDSGAGDLTSSGESVIESNPVFPKPPAESGSSEGSFSPSEGSHSSSSGEETSSSEGGSPSSESGTSSSSSQLMGNVDCDKLGLGIYEDVTSCLTFNLCVPAQPKGLRALKMRCPAGTKFDAELKICNHASKIDC